MNSEARYKLIQDVFVYCNFAIVGLEEFQILISKEKFNPKHNGIWYQLQSGLMNAAIVSSYIFSPKKDASDRTKYLQKVLMISRTSPLKNKAARNYLTHIDEKFDYYLNNSKSYSKIIETVVPSRSAFIKIDSADHFVYRAIIKDEMIFAFQTGPKREEFELLPILKELKFIYKNCQRYLKKLSTQKGKLLVH